MYISDITHFLDEEGNIPEEMPEKGKEFTEFLTTLIETSTREFPENINISDLDCSECGSDILTEIYDKKGDIHWFCPDCVNEGIITNWHGTKWDSFK